jgi:uncharacterized protein (DUF608 family)
MQENNNRRSFLKNLTLGGIGAAVVPTEIFAEEKQQDAVVKKNSKKKIAQNYARAFNAPYEGVHLNRIAFPIGGIGAGMFCLEGTGAISHMSVRHRPEIFHEPALFAAVVVKGEKPKAKVIEGPVPEWKMFGQKGSGNGSAGSTYGLPRFDKAVFKTKFPFSTIELTDDKFPLKVEMTGWSPFIPGDEDNSSMPFGALEYQFENTGSQAVEAIFSFNSKNFFAQDKTAHTIEGTTNGFVLSQPGSEEKPFLKGKFAFFTDSNETKVDHCWFRGGWWDPLTMAWNAVRNAQIVSNEPVKEHAPGASLYVPFSLAPGAKKTVRLMAAWYVPDSNLKIGTDNSAEKAACSVDDGCCKSPADLGVVVGAAANAETYKPWYSSKFKDVNEVIDYWKNNYSSLRSKSVLFSDSFYASTLPAEVIEAVAANLTIIKSPTVLRQYDGRLWSWEGCADENGCCHGSCTHVWNYAQAMPHLFPKLERSLRDTEFCENQNNEGHQGFRANMPISPLKHDFHAAADGQLGGIMKVYRDWRISGDDKWLAKIFPMVKRSMDYCITTWDPRRKGVVEEPHHNTYDIEFWGPDGMCTSFYLGALRATIEMSKRLKKDAKPYQDLYNKGKAYMESSLYNGEYFIQEIKVEGLSAPDPAKAQSFGGEYSAEAIALMKKEGPKYQYGTGCLSDGVLGVWMGRVCGLPDVVDSNKVTSHLLAIHKYNLKEDLSEHDNPQRPAYAVGKDGGLLLCTWPKGGKLSLPFVYSDEVWTGIEYQVAAHLMLSGKVEEGLDIVKACRARYDGRVRNPFNEYECGHWYARAMSSYSMLQGLTGLRYDAVDKAVYIDSKVGDFTCFISTANGFGTVRFANGKPSLKVASGNIDVKKWIVAGKEIKA